MATGYERSVFLVTLLLFCMLGVCTGLTLELSRMGQDSNRITLTCSDTASVQEPNALFYMRAPGTDSRMLVDGNSGLVNFTRNGGAITFTITPETEANFTCASSLARRDETSGLLLAGGKSLSWRILLRQYLLFYLFLAAFRDNNTHIPPRTQNVLVGETVELECDIQPGRARELYRVEWFRYGPTILILTPDYPLPPPHQSITASNFSLSVSIEDMSQNGSGYQCVVGIRSCSPYTCPEWRSLQSSDGARITLVIVGGM